MTPIPVDQAVAQLLLRYAKLLVARGYVHNSLGNLAIRVPHPDFPHGVAYTKHAEVSLEEMTLSGAARSDAARAHARAAGRRCGSPGRVLRLLGPS